MKYSVNYNMSFGIDVTQQEIDQQRQAFDDRYKGDSIFSIVIDKNSSDEQIAKFIGLSKFKQAEVVDMDELEVYEYPKELES
jgi:hypothetical protein